MHRTSREDSESMYFKARIPGQIAIVCLQVDSKRWKNWIPVQCINEKEYLSQALKNKKLSKQLNYRNNVKL